MENTIKSYVLSTSIGTFKLVENLDLETMVKNEGVVYIDGITESGMPSHMSINLDEVKLLAVYVIDEPIYEAPANDGPAAEEIELTETAEA